VVDKVLFIPQETMDTKYIIIKVEREPLGRKFKAHAALLGIPMNHLVEMLMAAHMSQTPTADTDPEIRTRRPTRREAKRS